MYIETKEIGPEGLTIKRLIDALSTLPLEGSEKVLVGPIQLDGQLDRDPEGITFEGEIATVATLTCSRCLESYRLPLQLHFGLLYTSAPEPAAKGESRVDEGEITRTHYDGYRIDLNELLSEQIYLGVPLKPLCRPDCPGLCQRCGANLNEGACGCSEEPVGDPRLQVLKRLL